MSENNVKIDVVEFMGKKLNFLDLGKDISPDILA